ncbi:MAG: carboxypeptidase-like regulatory domain-containing protein [Pyrinomonadaceae bacterium]|nr:carboxypeptidase-like regulatory domain-containing protein [Pyrinomonadaceae bacterium]
MTILTLRVLTVLFMACLGFPAAAQSTIPNQKLATGSVSGSVTLKGKRVPGINVALRSMGSDQPLPALIATTDSEGNYRISKVPAGQYQVSPVAPTFVITEMIMAGHQGKLVILTEGESVDGIDFTLVKGGVITGKVLDADGRPVVEEPLNLIAVDSSDQSGRTHLLFFRTDDRGVYRIFGIPAGRYKVAVGQNSRMDSLGRPRRPYPPTYHPDTADAAQAEIVEVVEGDESAGIDITVGRILDRYAASGRIIDGETGQPLSNIRLGVARRTENGGHDYQPVRSLSSSRGEFKIEGLMPGAYSIVISQYEDNTPFADPVSFEVVDRDVNNLVVKTSKGTTLSGVVVLDGSNDKALLAKLYQLQLNLWVQGGPSGFPTWRRTAINPDGSFRLGGLPPGVATINTLSFPDHKPVKDFVVLHTEREGMRVTQGIELKVGDETTGLKVFVGYGKGLVRGELTFVNGTMTPGSRLMAQLTRLGESVPLRAAEVDARGHFAIEGMPAGTYWLQIQGYIPGARNMAARQQVNVVDGAVTEVTITLDLNPKSTVKP